MIDVITSLKLAHKGKVRDTYELSPRCDGISSLELLLMVASDRVSTHNVLHTSIVPRKGQVLTALSLHWMKLLSEAGFPHHMVASGEEIYKFLPGSRNDYPADLAFRAMVVKRLSMLPYELVLRRYLTGSLYELYKRGEDPYGIGLPSGLLKMCRFDNLLFTPTDKSETDDPVLSERVALKEFEAFDLARRVFLKIETELKRAGIVLVDSKLEIGCDEQGMVCVGDEIVTPDSSRFVRAGDIVLGIDPPWLDKQGIRDAAEMMWSGGKKTPLVFPQEVIEDTTTRYMQAFEMITGRDLESFQRAYLN